MRAQDLIAEGWVQQVSPLLVRFAGDGGSTAIAWKSSGLTFSLNEKLILLAAPSGWTVLCKPVAT